MESIALALRGLLIVLFAEACWSHLRNPARFSSVLQSLGLSSRRLVAPLVSIAEASVLLLLIIVPRIGGIMTASFLVATTAFLGLRYVAGKDISDCGCSGHAKPVDARFFARNLLLIAGAGYVSVVNQPALPPASQVGWGLSVLAAALFLRYLIPKLGTKSSEPIQTSNNEATSRRDVLRLGLSSAGVLALVPFKSLSSIGESVFPSGRGSENWQALIGKGADLREVREVLDRFPDLDTVTRQVPQASRIAWESSELMESYSDHGGDFRRMKSLYAPIVDQSDAPVGTLVRHTGVSQHGGWRFEERAQFVTGHGKSQHIRLLSEDGDEEWITGGPLHKATDREAVPVPLPTPSSGPEAEECFDPDLPVFDAGCKCTPGAWRPCPGGGSCRHWACHKCTRCSASCPKMRCCNTCDVAEGTGACAECLSTDSCDSNCA